MLLWAGMMGTRTHIRLLRHLGVALIFAPEPFTTPFGVACILAARHLSRRLEAGQNRHLRETVKYYLAHSGRFDGYVEVAPSTPGPAKQHGLSDEYPILGQITGSRSFAYKPSVQPDMRDARNGRADRAADDQSRSKRYKYVDSHPHSSTRTQTVIHHTMNMEWLSRRFESANSAVAHSAWATTSGAVEGSTHHSLNTNFPAQPCEPGSVRHGKADYRAINRAVVRQRYGSAENCTAALRALHSNNYYYDILSRGNVVGGY